MIAMRTIALTCTALFTSLFSLGQCLSERVNLHCAPCSLAEAIEQLEQQTKCTFSYNAASVENAPSVALDLERVSVKEALKKACNNRFEITERGRHILLIEKRDKFESRSKKQEYTIKLDVQNAINRQNP